MKKNIVILSLLIFIFGNTFSQTIGLIQNEIGVSDGYILFTPEQSTKAYLINNCGELINEWEFNEDAGLSAYLLENGNILRAGKDSLQIRDWDNNVIWTYATTDNGIRQHHDIEPLPNGNILCVTTEVFTNAEISELGRDPSITADNFRIDKIVELQPIGINDAEIVWEWKMSEHLIQDFDNTKQNFGSVEDHPELIDINFNNGYDNDWTHVNSVDYNDNLDQIIISVRHLNEIMIIDHSTSYIEVSGHIGGNSNMGGDIIFRWGNPQVYRQGDASSQKLYAQHDAKWIKDDYLDGGKISVFNNGGNGTGIYSSLHILEPSINGYVYQKQDNIFLPLDYSWSWNGDSFEETVNEGRKCALQLQENGNAIFVEYTKCSINEISRTGELLWSYVCPVGEEVLTQGQETNELLSGIFRGERYTPDFPGFIGKDMSPQSIIENENSISEACITTEIADISIENILVYPNPVFTEITILNANNSTINIFNLLGEVVATVDNASANQTIDISNLADGTYFVRVNDEVIKINVIK